MSALTAVDSTALTLTRRFKAAPDIVFGAWIEPAQLAQWLGPRGVQAHVDRFDARVGGAYHISVSGGERGGTISGTFREITPPQRLVLTWIGCFGTEGHETLITVTFRPVGAETEMTLTHERFESTEARDRHEHGWMASFERLAEKLAG
jgi:uncharacterized protein YndB with AHSA1/START domain